ncbi:universal stress protein [Solwaraspora sp. WMMB335]|uniref:universal stress protein n=1 Tax=Solwaraspora sp. WMMB335 TaxID=3404118 RepID=UPI003B938C07
MRPQIVVGLGGSTGGHALAWALDQAAGCAGQLLICHGCRPDSALATAGPHPPLALLELADPALARAIAAARRRLGGDRVQLLIRPEHPAGLLLDAARRADLVVVGAATGRPGDDRDQRHDRSTGTAYIVARQAGCPVAVVRPTGGAGQLGQVVVGADDPGLIDAQLAAAFDWADQHRCGLTVLTGGATDHDGRPPAARLGPWRRAYPQVPVQVRPAGADPVPEMLRCARGARLLVVARDPRRPAGRRTGRALRTLLTQATAPVLVTGGAAQSATASESIRSMVRSCSPSSVTAAPASASGAGG